MIKRYERTHNSIHAARKENDEEYKGRSSKKTKTVKPYAKKKEQNSFTREGQEKETIGRLNVF